MQKHPHSLRNSLILATVITVMSVPGFAAAQGVAGPYLGAQHAEIRGDVANAARLYTQTLARDPDNERVMERAMINQIAAGEVADGIALARRYEAVQPGHNLGVLAIVAGEIKADNLSNVRTLLAADGPFVAQVIDAWAAFETGDMQSARDLLTALESDDSNGRPGQIVSAYHLGLIEAAAGNDERAVEVLQRAAGLSDGGTLRLVRAQASALARLGRTEEAVGVINARLAGTYGDPAMQALAVDIAEGLKPEATIRTAEQGAAEVLFGVSGLLARGRNRLLGLAYARLAVYLDEELTRAQLLIAQLLEQDQQYELALSAYDALPEDAPEALAAGIGNAEVLQASGKVDEGIAAMREVLVRFPDALEAHTSLGNMLRRESRFEDAAVAYDGAVKLLGTIEPHHWGLLYQRGIALERSKQWDRAEADFRKALELEPDQPDVLNYLGYSLVELGQKLEEAEKMIEKAVDQRPEDGYIVDSLGWVLYRFGEFERATEHLERAVELRPVDPVINDHFGDALWMVGRKTEARFQWRRALSFEPTDKDADRIRRKLEEGLDIILEEEKAEGLPGIIGRNSDTEGAEKTNDGG
ncbi:MAG: tetratricopeptide repeat protein [Pseudomonadota bacterium]